MILPRLCAAMAALVVAATGAIADPIGRLHQVRIDVRCSEAVDRDQLVAALAIELAGTGWSIGDDRHEIAFTVDASPCTAGAALALQIDTSPTGTARIVGPIELTPAARARGLALLIAETIPEVAATAHGAPTPALALETRRAEATVPPVAPMTGGTETSLAVVRRWYLLHPDQVASGVRITAGHPLPARWLRAGLDLGADQIATPFGYQMFAARIGIQLGLRFAPARQIAVDVGARGELLGAYVDAASDQMIIATRWLTSAGAGGAIAATLDVSASLAARVEIEATAVLAAGTVTRGWNLPADQAPPPELTRAFSSSLALSIGLSIR